jgi:3-oxoacyl-[acyl-carrier protein] reductase
MSGHGAVAGSLPGRVALVTGGSGGIGSALCPRLAAAGAVVAVHYNSDASAAHKVVETIAASGGRAATFQADLREADVVDNLVTEVEASLGRIEVLVANAGLSRAGTWETVDAEAFDETLTVNLRAPYLLTRRVLTDMCKAKFGRILFTSSVAAFTGGLVGPHYAASKAGLHGLTHYLATRAAPHGVTVNAIAPALIAGTDMVPGDPDHLATLIPIGRLGTPEEVADLAMAIISNGYVTNQVVGINGGLHPA